MMVTINTAITESEKHGSIAESNYLSETVHGLPKTRNVTLHEVFITLFHVTQRYDKTPFLPLWKHCVFNKTNSILHIILSIDNHLVSRRMRTL